jgi:ribosomal protein L29
MTREAREELTRRQAALSGLTKNPNWPEYINEHRREIARIERKMLSEAKGPELVDQRAIDFWRGCLFILKWQIAMPVSAERNLVRYLRSQGVEIEDEEEEMTNV